MSIHMDYELTNNSDAIRRAVDDAIQIAFEKIGMMVETHAKVYCPVDTGRLRNSITYRVGEKKVTIGSAVEYAPYVEFGTSRHPQPQAFLRPAIENHIEDYRETIFNELKRF